MKEITKDCNASQRRTATTETTRCRHCEVQSTPKRWGSLLLFFFFSFFIAHREHALCSVWAVQMKTVHTVSECIIDEQRRKTEKKKKDSQRMEKVVAFGPPHTHNQIQIFFSNESNERMAPIVQLNECRWFSSFNFRWRHFGLLLQLRLEIVRRTLKSSN